MFLSSPLTAYFFPLLLFVFPSQYFIVLPPPPFFFMISICLSPLPFYSLQLYLSVFVFALLSPSLYNSLFLSIFYVSNLSLSFIPYLSLLSISVYLFISIYLFFSVYMYISLIQERYKLSIFRLKDNLTFYTVVVKFVFIVFSKGYVAFQD